MTRKAFLQFANSFYKEGLDIMEKKNHDYSSENNPFQNFEIQAMVSGVPTSKTFLIAIGIKIARLRELTNEGKEAKVVDESIKDSILDLANYACLMAGYLESKKDD